MIDRNCWSTPRSLFDPLHSIHQFTVDAAADASNALLPRYWTPEMDGLKQDWAGHRVWCNPPYGRGLIQPWVDKALRIGVDAVLLLPSRTETAWFHWLLEAGEGVRVEFLSERVRFVPPPGVKASSPTEASILAFIGGAARRQANASAS